MIKKKAQWCYQEHTRGAYAGITGKHVHERVLKTYKVGVWEEQGGYVYIQAKSQAKAEEIAMEALEENGMESETLQQAGLDITHRDIHLV